MQQKSQPNSVEDSRFYKKIMTQHKNMAFKCRSGNELSAGNMIEFGSEMMLKSRPQSMMIMILMHNKIQLQF